MGLESTRVDGTQALQIILNIDNRHTFTLGMDQRY